MLFRSLVFVTDWTFPSVRYASGLKVLLGVYLQRWCWDGGDSKTKSLLPFEEKLWGVVELRRTLDEKECVELGGCREKRMR